MTTQPPIWVLAVITGTDLMRDRRCASISIHPSYDAAVEELRNGWDIDGHYDHLDADALLESLRHAGDVYATIEACEPDWPADPPPGHVLVKLPEPFAEDDGQVYFNDAEIRVDTTGYGNEWPRLYVNRKPVDPGLMRLEAAEMLAAAAAAEEAIERAER